MDIHSLSNEYLHRLSMVCWIDRGKPMVTVTVNVINDNSSTMHAGATPVVVRHHVLQQWILFSCRTNKSRIGNFQIRIFAIKTGITGTRR